MIDIFESWRRQRRIGHTQRQLRGLSDHILDDIGLSRTDIALVGRQDLPRRGKAA